MEKEEAIKICKIMLEADGGCPTCAGHLLISFGKKFPEFDDMAIKIWEKEFGDNIYNYLGIKKRKEEGS